MFPVANKDIRKTVKDNHLPYWRVSKQLGVSRSTLTEWLRIEMEKEKRERVLQAVDELIQLSQQENELDGQTQ